MRVKFKNIAFLVIGDRQDFDSFQKIEDHKKEFTRRGLTYYSVNYTHLLKGYFPLITEDKIIVLLFFPFAYWNKHIEHKNYRGIYGNKTFYNKFVRLYDRIDRILRKFYKGKKIHFINRPRLCSAYRDKATVLKKLIKHNISQPDVYKTSYPSILKSLTNGSKFYLKPRYGSMGKGITFLSRDNWETNFRFKNNRIISRKSDYGWRFKSITDNEKFLKKLLKKDILVEKGLDHYMHKGNIADLRVYTFLGEVIYVYPRLNKSQKITTNISQGAKGAPKLVQLFPKDLINKAKREAVKVSKSLNIGMAGIDVIPDQKTKKVYVIDVNLFSGLPKRKTINIARGMAERLEKSFKAGKLHFEDN